MKNQEQKPVRYSETDGEVVIHITGIAFRNLKRIARTINAFPNKHSIPETAASVAERLAEFGHLGGVDDAEEASAALEVVAAGYGAGREYALMHTAFEG